MTEIENANGSSNTRNAQPGCDQKPEIRSSMPNEVLRHQTVRAGIVMARYMALVGDDCQSLATLPIRITVATPLWRVNIALPRPTLKPEVPSL